MTTACELPKPRPPTATGDVPHSMLGDLQRQQLSIDLDGCNVYLICQAMNEFDARKKFTMRIESWPQDVQTIFEREIAEWETRNPARLIKAYTVSVAEQTFTLALHWKVKP